jgi:hypothetical protein
MLAMALYLDKYVRQSLSDDDKSKVESAWLRKHQDRWAYTSAHHLAS